MGKVARRRSETLSGMGKVARHRVGAGWGKWLEEEVRH